MLCRSCTFRHIFRWIMSVGWASIQTKAILLRKLRTCSAQSTITSANPNPITTLTIRTMLSSKNRWSTSEKSKRTFRVLWNNWKSFITLKKKFRYTTLNYYRPKKKFVNTFILIFSLSIHGSSVIKCCWRYFTWLLG